MYRVVSLLLEPLTQDAMSQEGCLITDVLHPLRHETRCYLFSLPSQPLSRSCPLAEVLTPPTNPLSDPATATPPPLTAPSYVVLLTRTLSTNLISLSVACHTTRCNPLAISRLCRARPFPSLLHHGSSLDQPLRLTSRLRYIVPLACARKGRIPSNTEPVPWLSHDG